MNVEIKKVLDRVREIQTRFQSVVKNQEWVEEARKYADKQGQEVKKLFAGDLSMMKTFLERERKELERFQKQIPGEVKKFRKFLKGQGKELKKLISSVRKAAINTKKTRAGKLGISKKKAASSPV